MAKMGFGQRGPDGCQCERHRQPSDNGAIDQDLEAIAKGKEDFYGVEYLLEGTSTPIENVVKRQYRRRNKMLEDE